MSNTNRFEQMLRELTDSKDRDDFPHNCFACREILAVAKTADFIKTNFKGYPYDKIDRSGVLYKLINMSLIDKFINSLLLSSVKNTGTYINIVANRYRYRYDLNIRYDNIGDNRQVYLKFESDPYDFPNMAASTGIFASLIGEDRPIAIRNRSCLPKDKIKLSCISKKGVERNYTFKFNKKNIYKCAKIIGLDWTINIGYDLDNTKYFCDICKQHEQNIYDYVRDVRKNDYVEKISINVIYRIFDYIPESMIDNIVRFSGRLGIIC